MSENKKSLVLEQIRRMEQSQDVDGLMFVLREEFLNLGQAGASGHARMPRAFTVGEFMGGLRANPFFTARFLIIEAAMSLGRINNDKALEVLTGLANQEICWMDTGIGERIVMVLGETKDTRVAGHLIPLLKRKQRVARSVAAGALAQIPTEEGYKALLEADRKERDEHVRDEIRNALKAIEHSGQVELPKEETENKSWWRWW